jgi:hypothetical protein
MPRAERSLVGDRLGVEVGCGIVAARAAGRIALAVLLVEADMTRRTADLVAGSCTSVNAVVAACAVVGEERTSLVGARC